MGANRAVVETAAAKIGADVAVNWDDRDTLDVTVGAPAGCVWACTGDVHALVAVWERSEGGKRSDVWADLLERMADGVVPCPGDELECDCSAEVSRA